MEQDTIIAYCPIGAWGLLKDDNQDGLRLFQPVRGTGDRPIADRTTAFRVLDLRKDILLKIDQGKVKTVALGSDRLVIADEAGRLTGISFNVNNGAVYERCVLRGHKGKVGCLAFSPGAGRYLVAAGEGALTIWADIFAPPGNRLFGDALRLRSGATPIDSHQVALDQRWEYRFLPATTARGANSNAIVEIHDLSQHAAPRRLVTPFISVVAIAMSPDGARLAVTGLDPSGRDAMRRYGKSLRSGGPPIDMAFEHRICILDATSGNTLRVLSVPHRATNNLLFDPGGKTLLSVSTDRKMRFWDVSSGNLVRLIDGGGPQLLRPEYSPDGRWLASGSAAAGAISVWEVAKGEVAARFEGETGQSVWAFHGNLLAVPVKGRQIKVWDLEKGKFAQEMNDLGRKIQALAFLDHGKRLVSYSEGSLTLWTLETESEICSIPLPSSYANGQWPRIVEVLERLKTSPRE